MPGILAGLGMASYSRDVTLSILTGGFVAAVVDIIGRIKSGEASPALIHPDAGGHVWFIPIWIVGVLIAIFAVLARFGRI